MKGWTRMPFHAGIIFSPTVKIAKGEVIPFVEMANVRTGKSREPIDIEMRAFRGGTKFALNDTVVASIEPCLQHGKSFFVKNMERGAGSTEFMVFRGREGVTADRFVYYLMCTHEIRERMIRSMKGATGRQRVDPDVFDSIEIEIPDIRTQEKIASLLWDYDSAIENARRQIALLEEAAMRLYREWFGDGKGERKPLGEFIEITTSGSWGTDTKTVKTPNEVVCIRGADFEEIHGRSLGKQIRRFISDKHLVERSLKDGDLVVEMSGGSPTQSTGRVVSISDMLLARYGVPVLATNFCKVVRPKSGYSRFLYLAWRDLYVSRIMFNYEVGTTGIKNFDYDLFVSDVEITNPLPKLTQFNGLVDGMFSSMDMLGSLVQDLTEARDRLLPKLMSGEIEV